MERQVKRIGGASFCALLMALLALAACQLDLFDAVKREVEDYRGGPEIVVLKGIDEVPESADVPIGTAVLGSPKQVTFSIENHGKSELRLTGSPRVQIGGADAVRFSVYSLPASLIAAGGKSDLIIEFNPDGIGARTATLVIENDASADGAFDFSIVGEGVTTAGPEIQVITGSTVIDENQPYTQGFGKLLSDYSSAPGTFTIYNIGTPGSQLVLFGGPAIQISGADPDMFSVSQPGRTSLWQGDSDLDHTSFQVTYQPTAVGTHTATVTIPSTDGDEPSFTFQVTGICYRLDVLFLVGVNGMMISGLNYAKAGIADTMSALSALDSNAGFALATFNDFPNNASWGSSPAEAYALLQSLTNDQVAIMNLLNLQSAFDGNDLPASQLEALYQGTTGEGLSVSLPPYAISYTIPAHGVGWRAEALHVIVLISDSPFHNPEVDADYPGHTFGDTIAAMNAGQVEFIGMSVGSYQDLSGMGTIAAGTGGVVFASDYYAHDLVMQGVDTLMSQY